MLENDSSDGDGASAVVADGTSEWDWDTVTGMTDSNGVSRDSDSIPLYSTFAGDTALDAATACSDIF